MMDRDLVRQICELDGSDVELVRNLIDTYELPPVVATLALHCRISADLHATIEDMPEERKRVEELNTLADELEALAVRAARLLGQMALES